MNNVSKLMAVALVAAVTSVSSAPAMAFGNHGGGFGGHRFVPHNGGFRGGYGGGYRNRGFGGVGPAIGLGLLGAGALGYGLYNYGGYSQQPYSNICVNQYGQRVYCNSYGYGY